MEPMPHNIIKSEHQNHEKNISMTTLYELLEAIEEEIKPDEDWMVSEIVLNLFNSGKIRFTEKALKTFSRDKTGVSETILLH
jgi:predicted DNA-binding protein